MNFMLPCHEYKRPELKTKLDLEFMIDYYVHANFKLFQEKVISCCVDCKTKIVKNELPYIVFQVSRSDKGAKAERSGL